MQRNVGHSIWTFAAILAMAIAMQSPCWAQNLDIANKLSIAPEPDWVEARAAIEPSLIPVPQGVTKLSAYIEHWGTEVFVNGSQSAIHERRLTRIQQTSALAEVGVFRLDYSPDYQSVEIHRVDLIRGARRIPVLDSMVFRVSKVENDLERLLLTGKSAAIAQIPDARAGDVIDIAYTVQGQNPVFGEHFFANLPWNHSQYVHKRQVRLIHPEGIPVAHQFFGPQFKEAPSSGRVQEGRYKEQFFTQTLVLPAFYDNRIPKGYSPFLVLQFSSLPHWGEVHKWASDLFKTPPASAQLQALANEFSSGVSQKEAVARAAKFVQDDIRYFSVAISENTHKPHPPDVTLERRFGDCKDKALLLVALLRAMGTQAQPVLVSDAMGSRVLGSLATPLAFDHAVVRVVYKDRTEQMIDATLNAEGLPLEHQSSKLERSVGLIIEPRVPYYSGLKALGYNKASIQLDIKELVKIGGLDKESNTSISSRLYGYLAEATRQTHRRLPDNTRLQFLSDNFLQRHPSSRKESGFPKTHDNKSLNEYQIEEAYKIGKFLTRDDNNSLWYARFNARQLLAALSQGPLDKDRWLPLGLPMPNSIQHYRVEAEFPPEIHGQDDPIEDTLDTPFFKLKTLRSFRGRTFVFQADLTVTADEVLPAGMPDFIKAYEDAQKKLTDLVIIKDGNVLTSARTSESYRKKAETNRLKAIESATKTIEAGKIAEEDLAEVYLNRALARMDMGQLNDAESDIAQAIRRSPDLGLAFQIRATLHLRNKRLTSAENDLNKALGLGSEPGSAYLRRGHVRYLSGNFAGALKDFEQAEKSSEHGVNRGFMRVWKALARLRLQIPPETEAANAGWPGPLHRVFAGIDSPQTMINQIESANSWEERQLNLCEANFYLALWSESLGRTEDYRRYLEKTLHTGVIHFMEYEMAEILLK